VVGVDLQPVTASVPAPAQAVAGDVFEPSATWLPAGAAPFDLILSDMAPKTSGIRSADAARSAHLAQRVLALAGELLRPGGSVLVKVFQGAELDAVRAAYRERFERVSVVKPKASRDESVEVYLLGQQWRGPAAEAGQPIP
jgi:23S rRNA (uridine2552-2'-O)-methyltransferase